MVLKQKKSKKEENLYRMPRLEPQDAQVGGSAAIRPGEGGSAPATPTQQGTNSSSPYTQFCPFRGEGWWCWHWEQIVGHFHSVWGVCGYMRRMRFQHYCRWPGGSTWLRRIWTRSGHRAHGLDTHTYIYIFTYKFFGNVNFIAWICDFLATPHPVYHVYVFVLRGGKIYPNKEGRV